MTTCRNCGKADREPYQALHGTMKTIFPFGDEEEGLCLHCWTEAHYRREDDIHLKSAHRHKKKKQRVTILSEPPAASPGGVNKSLQERLCLCGCGKSLVGNAKKQFHSGACRVRYHRQHSNKERNNESYL